MKKVIVSGCGGKMGKTLSNYICTLQDYCLIAGVDPKLSGQSLKVIAESAPDTKIFASINDALTNVKADIVVDFTAPSVVVGNAKDCLNHKTPILIGTTGISQEDQYMLDELAKKNNTSIMIVPNFAIGAILMMNFAKFAAKYMKAAEIIELHHDQKVDKPSGTAIKTRKGMLEATNKINEEKDSNIIPIHSVRLPGLVAHQEVILGDLGQTLTIRHDSYNRDSFMPGIKMALGKMGTFTGLKVGLDLD